MFHLTKERNFLFFPRRELVYTFNPLTISTLYFDSVSRFLTRCNESDQIPTKKDTREKKERKIFKIKNDLWNYFLKIGLLILHLFLFTHDRCLSGSTCLSRTLDYRCRHDLFRRCGALLILVYRCCKYTFFDCIGKRIIINNRLFVCKKNM